MSTKENEPKQEEYMPVEPISALAEGMVDIAGHTVQAVSRRITSEISPSPQQVPQSREEQRRQELGQSMNSRGSPIPTTSLSVSLSKEDQRRQELEQILMNRDMDRSRER